MTNADIERATTTTADMVAAGLEQHARAITARVVSLLGEDRAHFTKDLEDIHTMLGAVAIETQAGRNEAREGRIELLAGVRGLAQDLSVVVVSVQEATTRLGKLERDLRNSNKRHSGQIQEAMQRIVRMEAEVAGVKAILAARPAQREQEHEEVAERVVQRLWEKTAADKARKAAADG